jgi:hypothetical protein
MQCSSGFDLGLASYEEVKLGLSDQTFLVENGRQQMSNQLGLLSNGRWGFGLRTDSFGQVGVGLWIMYRLLWAEGQGSENIENP